MERLQKVLANAGVASRRHCEELIVQGRVQVNGQIVKELGTRVDPDNDKIKVDGKLVHLERKIYVLLYKPTGYITSVSDPQGRRVVVDLLKGIKERVYPVGRLDYDTSGLLLLTNDGEMAHMLTHPSYEMDKVYRAWVKGVPAREKVSQLESGIRLEDGMTAPAQAKLLKTTSARDRSLLELTIHEGRNRQVRRMCEAIGHPVLSLERIQLGFLTLEGLQPGQYRPLTSAEVEKIKSGLSAGPKRRKRHR
ncbi:MULTISPECIES: pseudouridine synthase [Brevibacillus]|jgi:23S rRNA pseudouridine2605 synthase|uniref:Pseudouridine synthase n=1 Tax=Brevibacillus borstelensis AK1 TaxID=1300222 RepID=M8EDW2_9BACL|nr:pseudouridine synthase [Brevibacillus borstelensis]EMT53650.1 ribosomal large subunit pseudouridine synthase B [Brevibacillus borstelensis AK1]KKX56931.1 RNA pseudouridine synthase [Brevibacillus borstelensis cifa_chp40]MBE5397740.1 rRNA pseudouridine synthase [Brevibacillus borstelensis]MCM3469714.1 rRNA pseudouridine synthase [Brevibacillus borstelensis]MCM3620800.1 rRNA pseudouridine synthase [Brevibacillus borstelensis]